jgi:outer membrane protein assembly factor BamB
VSFLVFSGGGVLCAAEDSVWLVDPAAVRGSDVRILWQYNLPYRSTETVEQLVMDGDRLYVLSRQNYLTCMNRHSGDVIFSSYISNPGLPNTGLTVYDGQLMTTVGKRIIEINRQFGTQKRSTEAVYGMTCAPARNGSYLYVAGEDNRLHALHADNVVEAFVAAAENDSEIVSVIADANAVVFGTDAGNIICIDADRPRFRWQFDVHGDVAQALVPDDNSIYIASSNTNVYRIDAGDGKLVWKRQTEAMLTVAPVVTSRAVYQYVDRLSLVSLDKATGSQRWKVPGGRGLLAEDGDTVYVFTQRGELAAIDDARGKELYTVSLDGASCFLSNLVDSDMYVSDKSGRLACLTSRR